MTRSDGKDHGVPLGQRLRTLREELGLSLRQAASRTDGLSYGTIRLLEQRDVDWRRVGLGTLQALSQAYEVPLSRLLTVIEQDGDLDPNDTLRHLAKRVELERCVLAGLTAVREELQQIEAHLARLQADLDNLRLQ